MELVNFSVKNYRSITAAHKVSVSDLTVLIGKNNEGKSNLLKALDVAMTSLQRHAYDVKHSNRLISPIARRDDRIFQWERDYPIVLQKSGSKAVTEIRLEFSLSDDEVIEFKNEIKSNLNGTLPIAITVRENNRPEIKVVKSGPGSKTLNSKSKKIAEFIGDKISFNYIPAVRTEQEAISVVDRMLSQQLSVLEEQPEYIEALDKISKLQQSLLEKLSENIKAPLTEFLPGIKSISIEIPEEVRRTSLRRNFDIIIDDGSPTSLSYKGDGVKSLAALSLLKDRINTSGASIIAIEEPESHLHPAAIHQLYKVIKDISENSQVILSSHNPLFVNKKNTKSNIIIDKGKATQAKSIAEIRDILGVKVSDNLTNAKYALLVEGDDDFRTITFLLGVLSEKLRKALDERHLVIIPIGGASKLSYHLTLLESFLCTYHILLDNDEEGRNAYNSAMKSSLASAKNVTLTNCQGAQNSELEDCFTKDTYIQRVSEEFGVDLSGTDFRGSAKWSDRLKNAVQKQGKLWDNALETQMKAVVSECICNAGVRSLCQNKRTSIDALVVALEKMISI